ncbi:DNA alkylation repair protein [Kutzneria sp. CA-103260]|uniref:DNA alkylation repair protein n=1 Tax=Kutzneria sp. CA-103260 TaxID=2802641 RepID=UPI001BAC60DF|nr:DNA alkylation repair protein [Kutzneria sp. CA-103260]QUQ63786.1 DNA alkylation repair enzyme [Kutzneria sp. CA-103260]
MEAGDVTKALVELADPGTIDGKARFFKAVPGGYGEGDRFLGVTVPDQRRVARRFAELGLDQVRTLLITGAHEERLTALFILVRKFAKADEASRKEIIDLYLADTAAVNNWDLVDSSAFQLLGEWLIDRDRGLLNELAGSQAWWERRIAIMATFAFIRRDDHEWTLRLADKLVHDDHDLIHKAVGWMLREVGERDREAALAWLARHHRTMPRTMLRYAIEKFDSKLRKEFLAGTISPSTDLP